MTDNILESCLDLSVKKLLANSTPYGLLAASASSDEGKIKNYTSLFSRDIGVCSLGILVSENEQLIASLKQSLISLTKAQSALGQFPFYFRPEKNITRWWTPGALDSTLWWCIAFLKYYQTTKDISFYNQYKDRLEKAFVWLTYQDTNNDSLLEQGEASDWADEMPRFGIVAYSNTLWYWLITLRIDAEKRNDLTSLKQRVYEGFNTIFSTLKKGDNNGGYIPHNEYVRNNVGMKNIIEYTNVHAVYLPYYYGFVSHKSFEMRCDVYANILACYVGLANEKRAKEITEFIVRSGSNLPYPVKALYPPIYPGEPEWREYMAKGRQNYPWQYHNGGIWPYIGGFWVMWLAQHNKELAKIELEKLAQANALNNWEFNEYLHGQNGTPMGVPLQSWNMAMYIAAYKSLQE